ncbi:MAG: hypothetical protein ACE14V_07005, partial [bacterium]
MKTIIYLVISICILSMVFIGCAKKEEAKKKFVERVPLETGLEQYFVDANVYPKPSAMDTTASAKDEMVTCSYDSMKMKKSAMQASMEYKGKTLYF